MKQKNKRKTNENEKRWFCSVTFKKKYTMHQFYVAEFGRIGAKVNWDLAFCGYANDKKRK